MYLILAANRRLFLRLVLFCKRLLRLILAWFATARDARLQRTMARARALHNGKTDFEMTAAAAPPPNPPVLLILCRIPAPSESLPSRLDKDPPSVSGYSEPKDHFRALRKLADGRIPACNNRGQVKKLGINAGYVKAAPHCKPYFLPALSRGIVNVR